MGCGPDGSVAVNKWQELKLGGHNYRLVGPKATRNQRADALIHGDRQEAYGHPLDDFTATAEYWSTWLRHKYHVDITLEASDVPWMMSLLKHSREGNGHKDDNGDDACGYLGTDEMVRDEQARRAPLAEEDAWMDELQRDLAYAAEPALKAD